MKNSSSHDKLFTWLNFLEIKTYMNTFRDRKRMQKLVYLIQEFGLDNEFHYDWYLQGPYSPYLTRTIYDVLEEGYKAKIISLDADEKSKLRKFQKFIGEDYNSVDALELLASLHYLRKKLQKSSKNIEKHKYHVIDLLREKKPFFSRRQIEFSWLKLDVMGL